MSLAGPDPSIVDDCLARIDTQDGAVRAMVHVDRKGALRAAAASAQRWRTNAPLSLLDGLPLAIKANIAVAGWPWTAGIGAYAERRAERDAGCVARLRAAGAVLIGLTNMDEGALGAMTDNRWFGRTHNPHRRGFTAGGSSGGSAAAVAAGFCVAALGTDTIGSIRIPAAYCGIVGHKPQRGVIASEGVVPLSPTLDHVGIMAGSAGLCGVVTQVLEGGYQSPAEALAGRSVAVPEWREVAEVSPDIDAAFDALLDAAQRAGLIVTRVPAAVFPFARAQRLLLEIAETEGAMEHGDALHERPDGFSPEFAAMLAWGAGVGRERHAAGLQELAAITAGARAALARFDAVLLPTTPQTAFAFDSGLPRDQAVFATLAACLGDPATAFPIGLSRDRLPMSAQVMAKNAALCLAIAAALGV
jgi:aspartyl-tRNA(Asn)/glutamyl-tRNA(Gln) amidotransferase subunit A